MPSRVDTGRLAEDAAADHLVAHGYRILARNLRLGALELDLVAQRDDLVAIVEVRTRGPGALQGPLESISPAKQRRLRRAAERLWRDRLSAMPAVKRVRLDVIAVTLPDGEGGVVRVEHVEDALPG